MRRVTQSSDRTGNRIQNIEHWHLKNCYCPKYFNKLIENVNEHYVK